MWQSRVGLMDEVPKQASNLTRRQALTRAGGAVFAVGALPAVLAACGSDSSGTTSATSAAAPAATSTGPAAAADITGDLVIYSYPDWYGPKEFADFHAKYPGATVKDVPSGSGAAQQIATLAKGKGNYDLTLAGVNVAEQFQKAGLLEPFDASAVPKISTVAPAFTEAFPYGIPTDWGRTGYGYRKDLIPERPTTWKELWELAAKYSGKTTSIKYDADVQGSALKYLGYSTNTGDKAELDAMQKALLELKPHLRAIVDTDFSKALISGDAFFAIDYDYDIALAQESNKDIVWVQPTEGVTAYLEGWIALKGTKHLPAVWALMDFHLQPKNYASFINAMGPAYTVPDAEPYIKKAIVDSKVLKYTPESIKGVDFQKYVGPEVTAARGKLWEQFLAA
jgi:spermidine/putrescine transport system substrate-binding protein